MSDAQLRAGFEACVRRLTEIRNRPNYVPLHAAFCSLEGPGGNILQDGLFCPLLGHHDYAPRVVVSTSPPDCYAVAFYTPREFGFLDTEQLNTLLRQIEVITEELQSLYQRLPIRVREHLCLPRSVDWWRTLFHLAWHFDRAFLSSSRDRMLTSGDGLVSRVDETVIQQLGCAGRRDALPGLIFGLLKHDASTASEAAVGVLLDALQGNVSLTAGTPSGDTGRVFAILRDRFLQAAELEDQMPGPKTVVRLLRFSDSFRTPPATEWAGLELGGQVESMLRLARINADQEFCQVRGPATRHFIDLATETGDALAPGVTDCATLFDERRQLPNGFVTRVAAPSPVLSPGPAERWLRFVFSTLKRLRPDELPIQWGTVTGASSYGMATLKQNIFAASALAIELAELTLCHTARRYRVLEWESDEVTGPRPELPPPGSGRFILLRELRSDGTPGGNECRLAWTWAENEHSGVWTLFTDGLVVYNLPAPPECHWLQPDWPTNHFPLGLSLEHLRAWADHVRSRFDPRFSDTVSPDDRAYGWLATARAVRALARQLGVIGLDRVVAQLPASREDARREVEPLLDGLIVVRGRMDASAAKTPAPQGSQQAAVTEATTDVKPSGKPGRPTDDRKREIVKFVRKLREKGTPWKNIPEAVFEQFKVRYTSETLRGYLNSG